MPGRGRPKTPHNLRKTRPRFLDPIGTVSIILLILKKFDFVFIALHGTFGEDGTIQRILEENQIPFNGSNSEASKLCFSKAALKILAKKNNILTPEFVQIKEINGVLESNNFSVFKDYVVKPNQQGSSLGIYRKKDLINECDKRIKSIFELDN